MVVFLVNHRGNDVNNHVAAGHQMRTPGHDSAALSAAINAIMEGMGRGGLTYMADRLGMTASAMRKRLHGQAFDEPTMRAVLLIAGSKAGDYENRPLISEATAGPYLIQVRDVDGQQVPTWRLR